MAKDGERIRRGGRWIQSGDQYRDRHPILRKIVGRIWYLLVPFVGIMCANDTYVRPDLEEIKSQKNLDRKALLDEVDDLRADISVLQSEVVLISAELDTVHLPRVRLYSGILDSLLAIRRIYDEELPRTEARIDSLRQLHEEILAEIEELSTDFRRKSGQFDSLKISQASLEDSVVVLDDLVAVQTDHLYRLRNPREFRGKEALFTGEGEYPRRDESAPRQKEGQ